MLPSKERSLNTSDGAHLCGHDISRCSPLRAAQGIALELCRDRQQVQALIREKCCRRPQITPRWAAGAGSIPGGLLPGISCQHHDLDLLPVRCHSGWGAARGFESQVPVPGATLEGCRARHGASRGWVGSRPCLEEMESKMRVICGLAVTGQ